MYDKKNQGFGGSKLQGHGAIASSRQIELKSNDEAQSNTSVVDDKIAKIQQAFDAARQGFHKIPEALKAMPKMNPKGLLCLLLFQLNLIRSRINVVLIAIVI